ncbi:regulator of (H+)-ATPase in vacuolar membrane [Geranomyces variabilis]|uniref:Regulator of (H+)-ATPase in vacuolar membrane n=1 Tax=Geranomyces variabilis TaxID=109894 RepID=A0AAD5TGE2_9FUNG|nr:regulator of (H+)-ATPase in vacuolar membrane [Geranomyces variabilis]
MHLLQQLIAPRASTSVATGIWGKKRYLVYGSGTYCYVYTAENTLLQVLRIPSGVSVSVLAVALDSVNGLIAVSFGSDVSLFSPQVESDQVQWTHRRTTRHDFLAFALSWSPSEQLLVAGRDLELWQPEAAPTPTDEPVWSKTWSCSLASDAIKAQFSPDGRFFVSLSKNDRLPKVWFSADVVAEGPRYRFAYLPHPASVSHVTWRRKTTCQTNVFENALLTTCSDNISRLWCLLENSQPFQFHLGAVIDPTSAPIADEDDSSDSGSHARVVHWLHDSEVQDAISQREMEEARFSKISKRKPGSTLLKTKKLKSSLKDYSDILFHVQRDGSTIFWGIQHLTGQPRHASKVILLAKTENTLPAADFEFFQQETLVYHNEWGTRESAIFFPAEVQILAQRHDGAYNAYTMNLEDFFVTSWMIPRLSLKHSWIGLSTPIVRVSRHPNMPLIANFGSDGEIIIFHSSVPITGLRTTDGLTAVKTLPSSAEDKNPQLAWLPHGPYFILLQNATLTVHSLQQGTRTYVSSMKGYDPTYPLLLLHAYVDPNAKKASESELERHQTIVYVVGVSEQHSTVFVWALHFEADVLQDHSLISKTSLQLGSDVTVLRALPTDDLCLTHYPQSPMGAHFFVTYSSDKLMRFWHCCDGSLLSLSDSSDPAKVAIQQDEPWRVVGEFEYQPERLDLLQTDAFGKMCTVSISDGSSLLTIWGNEATGLDMRQEWATRLNDTVVAIDWFFSSDGQHLLAVGLLNRVYIFCQRRLASVEDLPTWDRIGDMEIAWPNSTSTIAWLPTGSLQIATEQTVLVYDKWMDETSYSDIAADAQVPLHTFSVVDARNGRLPDHHPQLLIQYLLWGKFDFVRYSLSLLHCFVKLMVDSGRNITETPVPLWRIFADDEIKGKQEQQYDALFDFGGDAGEKKVIVGEFSDDDAAFLSEALTRTSLPNISHVDQMLLLAVIDTLVQVEKQKRSLDENGVRYILFVRLFLFSQRSFPASMKAAGLTSRDIAWGFFTDSHDILLDFVSQSFNNKVMWSDAKALGLGYWLRNPDTMRKTMESIARNQYMGKDDSRNPVDCSLFYIALRKKNVVLGLWKLSSSHPEQAATLRFLANDFEEDRWKAAALKNAFALLGKQRYEYAVAFFLLADKLKDAVSVCLKQLNDPQLATILCRLYEGEDGPILKETLSSHILPNAIAKGDRWLAAIAFTMLKQRDQALFAVLSPLDTLLPESAEPITIPGAQALSDPALLVFYHYLRRSYRILRIHQPRISADLETEFVYRSAQAYERLGCPGLALDIIRKADALIGQYVGDEVTSGTTELQAPPSDDVAAGNLHMEAWGGPVKKPEAGPANAASIDWGAPVSPAINADTRGAADFDWGAPTAKEPEPATAGGFDWSEPVSSVKPSRGDMDWGEPVSTAKEGGTIDWGEPSSSQVVKNRTLDDEFEAFKKSIGGYDDPSSDLDVGDDEESNASLEAATNAFENVSTAMSQVSEPPDPKRVLRLELEKRNMRLYKWMLSMRIVQAVYKSVSVVSKNREILASEDTFRDYFKLLIDGIRLLLEIVEMPVEVMDRVLVTRCREMNAVLAFVELAPLRNTLQESLPIVETFLVEQSNELARLTLGLNRSSRQPAYVESLARQILLCIVRWTEWTVGTGLALNKVIASQAAATAYMMLTVSALRGKDYAMTTQLVLLCASFFELLLAGNIENLTSNLLELSTPRSLQAFDPDAERDNDSGPDEDDFEEKSPLRDQLQAETSVMCDDLIAVISLQHVAFSFDGYLAQLRSGASNPADESHGFLCDAVLRPISISLRAMQKHVAESWICGGVKTQKIRKYLNGHEKKQLWDTLRKTISVPKMIDFVLRAREEEPLQQQKVPDHEEFSEESAAAAADPPRKAPELIYRAADIIHTFAVNPYDHNEMAVGTHRGIFEVDVENAKHFFQRKGTSTDIYHSVDDIAVRSMPTSARVSSDEQAPSIFEISSGHLHRHLLKRRDTLTRKLSFDSMQKAIQTNMRSLRTDASLTELDAGHGVHHHVPGVSSLSAHPTLNYYLAGLSDPPQTPAVVQLYQFGQPKELVTYTSGTTARFTKTRFDTFGVRFGASDSKGDVYIWRFDASADACKPAIALACHSSFTNDLAFLNSSSLLATAGVSTNNQNVCMWDTLLPPARARVKAFNVAEGGAYSLVYSARHQLLFSGSKKGDIYVFDVRQRTLVDSYQAHEQLVKALAIDYASGNLVSGSMGGELKLWDLQTFEEQSTWSAAATPVSPSSITRSGGEESPTVAPAGSGTSGNGLSAYGIVQAEVVDDAIYTCAADGCVRRYAR